ncbi:hypothetical protein MMPV_004957 [Pyropia vietnamensis]
MLKFYARCAASAAAVATVVAVAAGIAGTPPEVIRLPRGLRPEGIAALSPPYFAVGSLDGSGRIYTFNGASGTGAEVFATSTNQTIAGLAYDATTGVLWAAGGPTGNVLALGDGGATFLASVDVPTTGNALPAFLNDVIAVPPAGVVVVTDSLNAALYHVPTAVSCAGLGVESADVRTPRPRRVPLTGDWVQEVEGFHANGIEYCALAQSLVVVQSVTGRLFAVGWDGVARLIPVQGGPLTFGDGLLFDATDPTVLYVARNRIQVIAVIRFADAHTLSGARVEYNFTRPDGWTTPTTVAQATDGSLLTVDARFGDPTPAQLDYFVYRTAAAAERQPPPGDADVCGVLGRGARGGDGGHDEPRV